MELLQNQKLKTSCSVLWKGPHEVFFLQKRNLKAFRYIVAVKKYFLTWIKLFFFSRNLFNVIMFKGRFVRETNDEDWLSVFSCRWIDAEQLMSLNMFY